MALIYLKVGAIHIHFHTIGMAVTVTVITVTTVTTNNIPDVFVTIRSQKPIKGMRSRIPFVFDRFAFKPLRVWRKRPIRVRWPR